MLRDALFLARMDVRHLLRGRETLFWTFLKPIVFFYFIGTITSNSVRWEARAVLAVSAPAGAGFLADELIERLGRRDYRVVRVQSADELPRYRRKLEIPAGFTDSVLAGKPMKIRFSRTGEDLNADYDRIRLARAVY